MTAIIVGLCGGAGALARFLLDSGIRRVWPIRFPVATVLINLTGSALLGVIVGYVATGAPTSVGAAVGIGFCGGYTTFSTAMVETVALLRERRVLASMCTLLGQPVVCVLAAAGAYALAAG
ncbi:fluoride efflux transporter FluC [Solicola gregarius]|uniref:Fluoride-specific ion channel FluC n=1 Tax=Solicola gregarius TaxID=2908642 RepID=A0AA46TJF1_9ACTN|nr:CrcB family protein [Solicola gregarius]UYM06442.1 CrcB family protein [Solicola gregarius]